MTFYDVAVMGGGASGMACAVRLAENKNLKTVLIEAGDRLGKKLAATGNGQGNVSNLDMTAEHFRSGNLALVEKIACANPDVYREIFDCLFVSDEKGRIYPAGKQASALTDCLLRKLQGKIEIIHAKVADIQSGFKITLSDGSSLKSKFVVLCTGGKAQKQFKTDGSAYSLATCFGHKLTALYPSLVQIKTDTKYINTLRGIRVDCAVKACGKSVRGDVIFTDYGISGNAVFSISPYLADKRGAEISLEFLPDIPAEKIAENLKIRLKNGVPFAEILSGTLHNQIGRAVLKRAGSDDIGEIVRVLKNFTLKVTGTLGFDYAQVTMGGIDMEGITQELESKYEKNLFFAGEILDVDGDCGGYNLQWAFASGLAVADSILKRV